MVMMVVVVVVTFFVPHIHVHAKAIGDSPHATTSPPTSPTRGAGRAAAAGGGFHPFTSCPRFGEEVMVGGAGGPHPLAQARRDPRHPKGAVRARRHPARPDRRPHRIQARVSPRPGFGTEAGVVMVVVRVRTASGWWWWWWWCRGGVAPVPESALPEGARPFAAARPRRNDGTLWMNHHTLLALLLSTTRGRAGRRRHGSGHEPSGLHYASPARHHGPRHPAHKGTIRHTPQGVVVGYTPANTIP